MIRRWIAAGLAEVSRRLLRNLLNHRQAPRNLLKHRLAASSIDASTAPGADGNPSPYLTVAALFNP